MNNRVIKLFIFCLVLFASFSCKKLLDVDVESDITEQNYWRSEGDYQNYLVGIYSYFRGQMNELDFGEERSGMYVGGSLSRFSPYWAQVINPDNTRDWQKFYSCIGHANLLLDKIKSFKFTNEDAKNRIAAEALGIRAAMYFHIAKIYGDVPLMLQPIKDEDVPLKERVPVLDVFKQINHDIDSALSLFPSDGIPNKYYLSKPAVEALKADVNIWQAKVLNDNVETSLKMAVAYIDSAEKHSGAKLLDDLRGITDRKNDEIIWSLYMDRSEGEMYAKYAFPLEAYSGGADNAADLPMASSANTGYATFAVSPLAQDIFNRYPQDERISVNYITEISNGKPGLTWPNKFRGHVFSDGRIADDDIIMYRLGGLLLLKAEAYAALNNPTEALKALNRVRLRSNVPDFNSSDIDEINREILDERAREVFFENKRWWDLVRAYKWGTIDIYQTIPNLVGKTTPIYWAISTKARSLNPNLDQTDGYTK